MKNEHLWGSKHTMTQEAIRELNRIQELNAREYEKPAEVQQSQIDEKMAEMEKSIRLLHDTVAVLVDRLAPISIYMPSEKKAQQLDTELCPLAGKMAECIDGIDSVTQIVHGIHEALRL